MERLECLESYTKVELYCQGCTKGFEECEKEDQFECMKDTRNCLKKACDIANEDCRRYDGQEECDAGYKTCL